MSGNAVSAWVVIKVPLWWELLIMAEAMHVQGQKIFGKISVPSIQLAVENFLL